MSDSPPDYSVAVRTLCDFAARQGDLDLRFTPAPSAQEGIAGHRTVASRRSAGYRSEVALMGRYRNLTVRGRADGFDAAAGLVEEVKTFKGELARMPANHRHLHWAQAMVYAALLCEEHGLDALDVSLVYFDVQAQAESPPLIRRCSAAELKSHFEQLCERFIAWADSEAAHRGERDIALTSMRFPHADFRTGQRSLAQAVFNAARSRRCLTAQAPTGIGKTMGTLFPLLKACPSQAIDKVFFLTAKGSGRALALRALDTLVEPREDAVSPRLRVIELVAREKACEHPDKACHGDSCPLAKGFYDRLAGARAAAVAERRLTRDVMRIVAREHQVCPYFLAQELVQWSDVIVGDYNHYFDSSAILHASTAANEWRVAVLVDEAHNLVDRARGMYSAELSLSTLKRVLRTAPLELQRPLDKLRRAWIKTVKPQTDDYEVHAAPPPAIGSALKELSAALSERLADAPTEVDADLLAFYFDVLQFGRLLESFGTHSLFDATLSNAVVASAAASTGKPPRESEGAKLRTKRDSTLCIRNVVPAPFLAPRFAAAHCSVLFSATLSPQPFYADTLGLPSDTAWLDVEAPFDADQLAVHIVRNVSTRFADRERSLVPIAQLIADQYGARPGNYIAYFSSFDYLEQAARSFAEGHPHVPMWRQTRRMDEAAREAFVARFEADGRGVGFAVLGGAFAEGIDLPGTRLIGAIVATLGLPQFNPVNEELRRRLEETFGAGYDYTYLFPGIRKVVQAAGRVIRTPSDRGTLHLIDDRFGRREVQRLLPAWWRIEPAPKNHITAPSAQGTNSFCP